MGNGHMRYLLSCVNRQMPVKTIPSRNRSCGWQKYQWRISYENNEIDLDLTEYQIARNKIQFNGLS